MSLQIVEPPLYAVAVTIARWSSARRGATIRRYVGAFLHRISRGVDMGGNSKRRIAGFAIASLVIAGVVGVTSLSVSGQTPSPRRRFPTRHSPSTSPTVPAASRLNCWTGRRTTSRFSRRSRVPRSPSAPSPTARTPTPGRCSTSHRLRAAAQASRSRATASASRVVRTAERPPDSWDRARSFRCPSAPSPCTTPTRTPSATRSRSARPRSRDRKVASGRPEGPQGQFRLRHDRVDVPGRGRGVHRSGRGVHVEHHHRIDGEPEQPGSVAEGPDQFRFGGADSLCRSRLLQR